MISTHNLSSLELLKNVLTYIQAGEYTFEITIDGVNMVENKRRTTQSEYVKELRFSKNFGWSQFAYLEFRETRSGFSIPLDFEIAKVACIKERECIVNFLSKFQLNVPRKKERGKISKDT